MPVDGVIGTSAAHSQVANRTTMILLILVILTVLPRDRKVAANKAAAERLADEIRTKNLAKDLIGSRIKLECWDAMEVQKKEVRLSYTVYTLALRQGNWS